MCKCTPEMRTPFCGVGDCVWPEMDQPKKAVFEVILTGHAVDRASQRLLDRWQVLASGRGLYSWLIDISTCALDFGLPVAQDGNLHMMFKGIVFVFSIETLDYKLLTVYLAKEEDLVRNKNS